MNHTKNFGFSRKCGILMPISSLPSPYGIGNFGKGAYDFIDFLDATNQKCWQVLPLNPTSYGDSPYQSPASSAGNPYFIDPEILFSEGLITKDELLGARDDSVKINYGKLFFERYPLLRLAHSRFSPNGTYRAFCKKCADWLTDYALFMALKTHYSYKPWTLWEDEHKNASVAREHMNEFSEEMEFWKWVQYEFTREWQGVLNYAHKKGISIIGDMPIYVAHDSVDVWRAPEQFLLDDEYMPTVVAGCPPDAYSEDGQLWGNPIYNWELMKNDGFRWWRKRVSESLRLYDILRIDHFRGFASFYSIPYGDENAKRGSWVAAPGKELFDKIKETVPKVKIIAEDLGFITDDVRELLAHTGFPGMKLLQFAFFDDNSEYLPRTYTTKNTVVYPASHDSDCTRSWFGDLRGDARKRFLRETRGLSSKSATYKMIELAMNSIANLAIIPMQDYLELTNAEGRMNTPSTSEGNWGWRVSKRYDTPSLRAKVSKLTAISKRGKAPSKKIISFDLDDTLLTDERSISEFTKNTLAALKRAGHVIVINTARSRMFAREIIDDIKPDYVILNGGAEILDSDGNTVFEAYIDVKTVRAVIKDLTEGGYTVSVQDSEFIFSNDKNFIRPDKRDFDFSANEYPSPSMKIISIIENEDDARRIATRHGLTYSTYLGGACRRFNSASASKWIALRTLADVIGITVSDVFFFGDDEGDLECIRKAGVGVIMKNADPEYIARAKHVTRYTNNEDGVAHFLNEYFGLKKERA